jgi:hypothetical protein
LIEFKALQKIETLLKAKQKSYWNFHCTKTADTTLIGIPIKIVIRNKYKIKDAEFGMTIWIYYDTPIKIYSNSVYVCQRIFIKNNHLVNKSEILRLEEQERNRLQIINANKTSKGNY